MTRRRFATWIQVLLGVTLLAVPTIFAVFAFELTSLSPRCKLAILAAWALIALVLVLQGVARDRSIERVTAAVALQRDQIRNAAEGMLFDVLLKQETGLFPASYSFIAYLLDETEHRLVPIWPRELTAAAAALVSFEPGKGATGLAFERQDVVVITGEAVYNDDHNLSKEQQDHWSGYEVVASAPIFTDTQVRIGALTGISQCNDGYFDNPNGQALLRQTASTLGVVLRAVRPE